MVAIFFLAGVTAMPTESRSQAWKQLWNDKLINLISANPAPVCTEAQLNGQIEIAVAGNADCTAIIAAAMARHPNDPPPPVAPLCSCFAHLTNPPDCKPTADAPSLPEIHQMCLSGGTFGMGVGGEAACEGHNFDESQCTAEGCCEFRDGQCWSAVGTNDCEMEAQKKKAAKAAM